MLFDVGITNLHTCCYLCNFVGTAPTVFFYQNHAITHRRDNFMRKDKIGLYICDISVTLTRRYITFV